MVGHDNIRTDQYILGRNLVEKLLLDYIIFVLYGSQYTVYKLIARKLNKVNNIGIPDLNNITCTDNMTIKMLLPQKRKHIKSFYNKIFRIVNLSNDDRCVST